MTVSPHTDRLCCDCSIVCSQTPRSTRISSIWMSDSDISISTEGLSLNAEVSTDVMFHDSAQWLFHLLPPANHAIFVKRLSCFVDAKSLAPQSSGAFAPLFEILATVNDFDLLGNSNRRAVGNAVMNHIDFLRVTEATRSLGVSRLRRFTTTCQPLQKYSRISLLPTFWSLVTGW